MPGDRQPTPTTAVLGGVIASRALPPDSQWTYAGAGGVAYARVVRSLCRLDAADGVAILVRGTVSHGAARGDAVLPLLREAYMADGTLPVEDLEGSFHIALVDGRTGRVVLYRNPVGRGFTYYRQAPSGFTFSSNLATLAATGRDAPRVRAASLPSLFVFRSVPGRETLFDGIERLLPGEEVVFGDGTIRRRLRTPLSALAHGDPVDGGPDAVEEVLSTVLADFAEERPDAANLLSGGVDSTLLQAIWARVGGSRARVSYAVSTAHPKTLPDREYAESAAAALGVEHHFVPSGEDVRRELVEAIARSAEPPNHVWAIFLPGLARAMAAAGVDAGLSGEGADSLFGTDTAGLVRRALFYEKALPSRALRRGVARAADVLGREAAAAALRLAGHTEDVHERTHPANARIFTELDAADACFGRSAVDAALAERRELATDHGVTGCVAHVHATEFLGEGVDTASLWTTLFQAEGLDLGCPFLDSRVIQFALRLPPRRRFDARRPKALLKDALTRHVPSEVVERKKLGFGQPVFEWMAPGGPLRPLVESIDAYAFVPKAVRRAALAEPGWFLYDLLCFDIWHKLHIRREPLSVG